MSPSEGSCQERAAQSAQSGRSEKPNRGRRHAAVNIDRLPATVFKEDEKPGGNQ